MNYLYEAQVPASSFLYPMEQAQTLPEFSDGIQSCSQPPLFIKQGCSTKKSKKINVENLRIRMNYTMYLGIKLTRPALMNPKNLYFLIHKYTSILYYK